MANRNHELDKPIIEAAKIEFLQNGFQAATIGNIAKRAGVTTGAIYTRYKGKDELFYSLIKEFLEAISVKRKENEYSYMEYCVDKNFDHFLLNIQKETKGYVDVLFKYYEECKLILCSSKGSSVEAIFREMMNNKISITKQFIRENIDPNISEMKLDLVELLMNQQFSAFKLVIEKGYSKEETIEYTKMLGEFIGAGWEKIFDEIINRYWIYVR